MRINQAADDSAGLAISEKMRGQIRGLEQAGLNIQNGISLVQVAEGGMAEIQAALQRVRELSVQSSNGTYTDEDRAAIQTEVTQLLKEIDNIANTTEYNDMALLAGKYAKDGTLATSDSLAQHVQSITSSNGINDTYTYNGTKYASAIIDFSNINSADDVANLVGKGVHYTCATCSKAYSIKFVDGSPDTSRVNNYHPVMEVDISTVTNGNDLVELIKSTAYGEPNFTYNPETPNLTSNATEFVNHYSQIGSDGAKLYIFDNRPGIHGSIWPTSDGRGVFKPSVYGEAEQVDSKFLSLEIQVGSNTGQSIRLDIPNMTLLQLGIENVLVNSQASANLAISQIDHAISLVSSARASVGVYQNRLEYAYANASNYKENLSASESRIRDADIAKEITELTGHQILLQSSQAMMVQANQITQGILQVLK